MPGRVPEAEADWSTVHKHVSRVIVKAGRGGGETGEEKVSEQERETSVKEVEREGEAIERVRERLTWWGRILQEKSWSCRR